MKSIRLFLVTMLLATVTLGVFVALLQGYRSGTANAQVLLDKQLNDVARLLAAEGLPQGSVIAPPSDRLAFQIRTRDGALVQRTTNAPEGPITGYEAGYREGNFSGYRWRILALPDGTAGRWIFVAERIDQRIALTDSVVLKTVVPIVVSLPIIAAITWFVVGGGLSLVRELATELGTKRADDLSPLTASHPPVELEPVVRAVNGLLRRLRESVDRERRFSADVAHELRTPISALRVHVHNLRAEMPEHEESLRTLDDDLGRLGHTVEQMLLLYRTTPEHYQAHMQALDLHELARSVIGEQFAEIDRRGQTISLTGSKQVIVGDDASLRILIANLIQNASKYSPRDSDIAVHVGAGDIGVVLDVTDRGPGIPVSDLARVFDRFYRVGGERHGGAAVGSGLGLSIVEHIARLHEASLTLGNNEPGPGLTATVVFPYHAPSQFSAEPSG